MSHTTRIANYRELLEVLAPNWIAPIKSSHSQPQDHYLNNPSFYGENRAGTHVDFQRERNSNFRQDRLLKMYESWRRSPERERILSPRSSAATSISEYIALVQKLSRKLLFVRQGNASGLFGCFYVESLNKFSLHCKSTVFCASNRKQR